jgi:hypothetical protein
VDGDRSSLPHGENRSSIFLLSLGVTIVEWLGKAELSQKQGAKVF